MHRPSAMDDPIAPLSHHWHDATHIAYGVATAGVFGRRWKLEASRFNGREPDEDRFSIDPIRLDSWSGRVTVNPSRHWSFTAGYGYLASPDALEPDESQRRFVASALHGRALSSGGQWASSFVVGANSHAGEYSTSWLAESEALIDERHTLFGRAELTPRTREELNAGTPAGESFRIASVSLGYIRELLRARGTTTGLGVRANVSVIPAALGTLYGSRTPAGGMVFLRVRPARSVSSPM